MFLEARRSTDRITGFGAKDTLWFPTALPSLYGVKSVNR